MAGLEHPNEQPLRCSRQVLHLMDEQRAFCRLFQQPELPLPVACFPPKQPALRITLP